MQIMIMQKYHFSPTTLPKSKNLTILWSCSTVGMSIGSWECRMLQLQQSKIWKNIAKLHMCFSFNPVIPMVRIYPKDTQATV